MSEEKIISFYPDFSKNHEFVKRITKILNRSDSSIGLCYLTMSVSNRFCVFIEPLNSKDIFSQITFGFDNRDRLINKDTKEKAINDYMGAGYSKEDLEALSELFSDFALTNHYESLLFGSKFFDSQFRKTTTTYILKYTPNEKANRYVVEGKRVSKHYSKTTLSNLREAIKRATISIDSDSLLVPCNVYLLRETGTLEETIKQVSQSSDPEAVVVEYYRDQETVEGYIKSACHVDGKNLILVNLSNL